MLLVISEQQTKNVINQNHRLILMVIKEFTSSVKCGRKVRIFNTLLLLLHLNTIQTLSK